ncbi:MAG: hypothetical protein LBK99_11730, partial [Opitutaceae bacterium]|nr:hypothetical protein [Opitutaceae bacterium]
MQIAYIMIADQSATESSTVTNRKTVRGSRRKELKNLMRRDGIWYFHKLVNGRRFFNGRKTPFSLDTGDLALAKAKRDAILRAASGAELDRVLGKVSRKISTLGEIFTAYIAADHSRLDVRKCNVRVLKRILARAGKVECESLSTGDLESVVPAFQDAVVAEVRATGAADDSEVMLRAKASADSMLTQARAVFAREKPFRRLVFDRPVRFLTADRFNVKRDTGFVPFSDAELRVFERASGVLRESEPGTFLVLLLMRWLGMRNEEVQHVKPAEWITDAPDGPGRVMRIT